MLKTGAKAQDQHYSFSDFEFHPGSASLKRRGLKIKLEPNPAKMLQLVLERPNQVVRREELSAGIWGDAIHVDFDQGLNYCARRIRLALCDDANRPLFLETIPKVGYMFIGKLNDAARPDSDPKASVTAIPPFSPRRNWTLWGVSGLVVLIAILSAGFYSWFQVRPEVGTISSIAILPLKNSTGDERMNLVVDGTTASMIRKLSQIPDLRVIAKASVERFRNSESNVQAAAKELGVSSVLVGTVTRNGGELALDVELIDARNGSVQLSRHYGKGGQDLLSSQSAVVEDVVNSLNLKLGAEHRLSLSRPATASSQAYEYYLRAERATERFDPESLNAALPLFAQAIAIDAKFALAYSQAASTHLVLALYFDAPKGHIEEARRLARRAAELDPSSLDPHAVLGLLSLVFDLDRAAANRELSLSSGRSMPRALAHLACAPHLLGSTGWNKEAEQWIREALLRDPVSLSLQSELGCNAYYAGQYERAIREFRTVLQIDPKQLLAVWGLARAQAQTGQSEEALSTLNAAPPLPMILAEKGYIYGKAGRADDAKRILVELQEQSKHHFVDPYQRAVVYLAMGDLDQTYGQLKLALEVKSPFLISIQSDPKWTKQLGDPRMLAFLEHAGLSRN